MTRLSTYHAPVLAEAMVGYLGHAHRVLDCTVGGGGHSLAILESGSARVIGLDRDPAAIAEASRALADYARAGRFTPIETNYAQLEDVPALANETFDGILLDLGVSSRQLDEEGRGFSFRPGAPLDMRMESNGETAADWLNTSDAHDLAQTFREYGDERRALKLANNIVHRRATRPFATSDDLVGAIRAVLGAKSGPGDFARLFQAVRIRVNDELAGLARALPLLRDRLASAGRMVVIAYHSGEDRLVKSAFREWSAACVCPPRQPVCTCRGRPLGTTLTRRAVVPSAEEIANNPRARSARLRAWQAA